MLGLLGHLNQSLSDSAREYLTQKERRKEDLIGDGIECGGSVLESGGYDLHNLFKHLCESREELS